MRIGVIVPTNIIRKFVKSWDKVGNYGCLWVTILLWITL